MGSNLLLVCGEPRRIGTSTTNLPRLVTCPKCKARTAAFKRSARARAAMLGVTFKNPADAKRFTAGPALFVPHGRPLPKRLRGGHGTVIAVDEARGSITLKVTP